MNEQMFDPATPALKKERPFLPRMNAGGILGRPGEKPPKTRVCAFCVSENEGLTKGERLSILYFIERSMKLRISGFPIIASQWQ